MPRGHQRQGAEAGKAMLPLLIVLTVLALVVSAAAIVLLMKEREMRIAKVFSTPGDQSIALMAGLAEAGLDPRDLSMLIHGTTVATNAVIERRGARCGLITTRGFRDVIELRRRNRPHTYGLIGAFTPLIPRELRFEVDERTDFEGTILVPVDETQVEAVARRLLAKKVEAVAVCFLHSYVNPQNEEKARQVLERIWPNDFIVLSSEIMPEFREFERFSTTAINAYVQPLVGRYLEMLARKLHEHGYAKDILLVPPARGWLCRGGLATRRGRGLRGHGEGDP